MLDTDDIRLCNNYNVCKSYAKSYVEGKNDCVGCGGDISPHRMLSTMVDSVIDPLADAVHHNTAQTMFERYGKAIEELQSKLATAGLEVSLSEANMLLHHRSLQVVRLLRDAVKRAT
jgi:hypothetical protein